MFKYAITLYIVLFSYSLQASIFTNSSRISGSSIQNGANVTVQDQNYSCLIAQNCSPNLTIEKSRILLKLWYEENIKPVNTSTWSLTVNYSTVLYTNIGTTVTKTGSLSINYNNLSSYKDMDIITYHTNNNASHYIKAVTTITSVSGSFPSDVHLETSVENEAYYDFPVAIPVVYHNGNGLDTATKELEIYWANIAGAESYDIEWLMVESDSLDELYNNYKNYAYDFRNATRINTTNTSYKISMAYPRGRMLFRARVVQEKLNGERIEGEWSAPTVGTLTYPNYTYLQRTSDTATNYLTQAPYFYLGLERGYNWQYAVTYAEQGKRKEVISYFDPALKNRQQVTVTNSNQTAIVGETVYDFVGRPAVQVLPSPTNNKGVRFYNSQTKSSSGLYDYEDFDIDTKFDNPNPIDSSNGASYYYSKSNATPFGINAQYTPTAGGFPYTRTQYKNDGTNRVKKQSGVGSTHKIGAGKETVYLYASPAQEEIDRLFGNEVGYSKYYKKNTVVDPNGQASVTYVDNYGRTIATALAGETPSNLVDIDTKPNTFDSIYSDLSQLNYLDPNNRMVVSHTFSAPSNTTYIFDYSLDTSSLFNPCIGNKNCLYDYFIYITNEYGEKINLAGDTVYQGIGVSNETLSFSVTLPIGTYQIHKVVTLNDSALKSNINLLLDTNACLIVTIDSVYSCQQGCDEICKESYTSINSNGDTTYINDEGKLVATINTSGTYIVIGQGFDSETAEDEVLLLRSYIQACMDSCSQGNTLDDFSPCEIKYQQLLADMSPGGQYFDNTPANDSNRMNEYLNTVVSGAGIPLTYFFTECLEEPLAQYPGGGDVFWNYVRENWKEEWGAVMVKYHPEWCAYNLDCCPTNRECSLAPGGEYSDDCNETLYNSLFENDTANYQASGYGLYEIAYGILSYPTGNASIDSIYQTLHHPTNGSIALGYMTSENFLNSTTDFYKNYRKYKYIDSSCVNAYLEGDMGITDSGFIIRYPRNIVYDNFSNPVDTGIILGSIRSFCTDQIAEEVDVFMQNFICKEDMTSSDTLALRNYLTNKKTANCNAYGDPNHNLTASLANFIDSLGYDVSCLYQVWPNKNDSTCQCDNLMQFIADASGKPIDSVVQYSSILNTTIESILANVLDSTDLANGITTSQLSSWYASCNSTSYNFGVVYIPSYFTCPADSNTIDTNTCVASINELSYFNELARVKQQALDSASKYNNIYQTSCLGNLKNKETFTMKYVLKEYHYTLYYYDQAGNLIKTVPPSGIYQESNNVVVHNSILTNNQLDSVKNYRNESSNVFIQADHIMQTNYKYNALNQLTSQYTPDGDSSSFFYDKLGRLIASQNAEQRARGNFYSLTKYDELGRVELVFELFSDSALTEQHAKEYSYDIFSWPFFANYISHKYLVSTLYDLPYTDDPIPLEQENLRNRISAVWYDAEGDTDEDFLTYYSYDINGNVKTILHENKALVKHSNQFKRIDYEYDLVSGNVNKVYYQKDQSDQFIHKYEYDADNRLTNAYTSKNGIIWEQESKNFYYPHGPLARTEIGDKQVQGVDYLYTIQGWLKSVNSSTGELDNDAGKDGVSSSLNASIAKDAYGYSLHYFNGDYQAIGSSANANTIAKINNSNFNADSPDLYNGNISKMIVGLTDVNEEPVKVIGNAYQYDQLNRIKEYTAYINSANDNARKDNSFQNTSSSGFYNSSYAYDGNGNIESLKRNGGFNEMDMDDIEYQYILSSSKKTNNKLSYITDAVNSTNYGTDIDNLLSNNYGYDAIGRLIKDVKEDIDTIKWNVSNKITHIIRSSGSTKANLVFKYDPMGNRISKSAILNGDTTTTYYVRDAQGNVMATYKEESTNTNLYLTSNEIYGSSRLGTKNYSGFIPRNYKGDLDFSFENWETQPFNNTSSTYAAYLDSSDSYNGTRSILVGSTTSEYGPLYASSVFPGDIINTSIYGKGLSSGNSALFILNIKNVNGTNLYGTNTGGQVQWYSVNGFTTSWSKKGFYNWVVPSVLYDISGNPIDPKKWILTVYTRVEVTSVNTLFDDFTFSINNVSNTTASRTLGEKEYELTNHLGNVMEVISDRKLLVDEASTIKDLSTFDSGVDDWWVYVSDQYTITNSGGELLVNTTIRNSGGVNKIFPTTVGKTYYLNFDVTDIHSVNGLKWYIQAVDISPYQFYPNVTLYNNVGNYTYAFVARTSSVRIKFGLQGPNGPVGAGEEYIKYDNIELKEIDASYMANVKSFSDYYPFGMKMPLRYGSENESYRYGFNGMQMDNEVYSQEGNSYTTFFRQNDVRLGRWLSVDPKAGMMPWQSPFTSMDNNPIIYNDPMGDEVINPLKAKKDESDKNLNQKKQILDGFEVQKGKEYRKAKRSYKRELRYNNSITKRYNKTEESINDFKKYDPDGFNQLDNLKDALGNTVDVYVETTSSQLYSSNTERRKLNGLTTLILDEQIDVINATTKEVSTQYTVKTKEYGKNTVRIQLSNTLMSGGKTLSHEAGHAIYNVQNLAEYIEWLKANTSKSGMGSGHEPGNPSGDAAHDREKIYEKNKEK